MNWFDEWFLTVCGKTEFICEQYTKIIPKAIRFVLYPLWFAIGFAILLVGLVISMVVHTITNMLAWCFDRYKEFT